MSRREIVVNSIEETRLLAAKVAGVVKGLCPTQGVLVGLSGELGGGKTTFSRELCGALGVAAAVTSPTFVLEHEYRTQGLCIEHWDLYRLGTAFPEELFEPLKPGTVRLIEWIERSPELARNADLHLTFQIVAEVQRRIAVEWKGSPAFDTLISAVF